MIREITFSTESTIKPVEGGKEKVPRDLVVYAPPEDWLAHGKDRQNLPLFHGAYKETPQKGEVRGDLARVDEDVLGEVLRAFHDCEDVGGGDGVEEIEGNFCYGGLGRGKCRGRRGGEGRGW